MGRSVLQPATEAPAPSRRIQSVDAVRGVAMVLMAIDHIRDYISHDAMLFSPTDLSHTTAPLFFTRWITHFCAPVFILTAGMGARLWMSRGHHSTNELSRFLVTRGIFLIVLEVTILRAVTFSQFSARGSPVILLILWAIGVSMIALAALAHLPGGALAFLSAAILLFHNLLDGITAKRFGSFAWTWDILHQQAVFTIFGISFLTAYPVLPWIGVMSLGYCFASMYQWDAERRQRVLVLLGMGMTVGFVVLRAINLYGDPVHWSQQQSGLLTVLSFLNVTKYPPSLDYLLMTIGPTLLGLAALEHISLSKRNPLIVFGRVPLFYYVAHLGLAHLIALAMNAIRYGWKPFVFEAPPSMGGARQLFPGNYGYPLWVVFVVWGLVIAMLYPVCRWYAELKQRRKDWWLSYL
ncbi:MAG TPA: heparan-alpha-glucosaminide N-acetyltransferase domain-containing protein [Acidobacteriaceae bacterium]|nr:heparan-alpha-glucosaminide N-acetyltransferase domain-containing protein [Acidobacteriaceae bacterium]